MKCLPKLPVPPVTRTDFSFRSIQGWVKSRNGTAAEAGVVTSGAMASAAGLMLFPSFGERIALKIGESVKVDEWLTGKQTSNAPRPHTGWRGPPTRPAQELVPRPR